MWLRYAKVVDLSGLHDELLAAGLRPLLVKTDNAEVVIEVADDVNHFDVDAVVDAHDPATSAATRDRRIANERTLRDRVDQALSNLENAWSNWGTLTPTAKDQTLRLNVRVTASLARLELRELDAT